MKSLKNKKGFTLIELLAVIVVLAVIMMIATTSVVPLITDSRLGGFASTANTVLSTVETVVLADEIKGGNATSTKCYDVVDLINDNYLDKITVPNTGCTADGDGCTSGYAGYVVVDKSAASTGGEYVYTIYLVDYANNYYLSNYIYGGTTSYGSVVYSDDTLNSVKGIYTTTPTTGFNSSCDAAGY